MTGSQFENEIRADIEALKSAKAKEVAEATARHLEQSKQRERRIERMRALEPDAKDAFEQAARAGDGLIKIQILSGQDNKDYVLTWSTGRPEREVRLTFDYDKGLIFEQSGGGSPSPVDPIQPNVSRGSFESLIRRWVQSR